MSDELSLAALSATALTEGLKFLYNQAGELLKARRERRKGQAAESMPAIVKEPAVLPPPDIACVERFSEELRALRADLHELASGVDQVDLLNPAIIRRIDALRSVIEAVYGIQLIFKGEVRLDSPPQVHGRIDVDTVAGYVAAVRADQPAGRIVGDVRVGRVESGAEAIGVDLRDCH